MADITTSHWFQRHGRSLRVQAEWQVKCRLSALKTTSPVFHCLQVLNSYHNHKSTTSFTKVMSSSSKRKKQIKRNKLNSNKTKSQHRFTTIPKVCKRKSPRKDNITTQFWKVTYISPHQSCKRIKMWRVATCSCWSWIMLPRSKTQTKRPETTSILWHLCSPRQKRVGLKPALSPVYPTIRVAAHSRTMAPVVSLPSLFSKARSPSRLQCSFWIPSSTDNWPSSKWGNSSSNYCFKVWIDESIIFW